MKNEINGFEIDVKSDFCNDDEIIIEIFDNNHQVLRFTLTRHRTQYKLWMEEFSLKRVE